MEKLPQLFENNRRWSERIRQQEPDFFSKLAKQQSPEYLWIGCSDSRVPSNQIVDLLPGEIFVHRNIANVVVHTDMNCISVMQYAVEMLKVRHIIVCGHYGCGGVTAALGTRRFGLVDNWLRHIQDVAQKHAERLERFAEEDEAGRITALCELNVIEQAVNVCHTTVVRDAWNAGQELSVHGWIYSLKDGLLTDLKMTVSGQEELPSVYQKAVEEI